MAAWFTAVLPFIPDVIKLAQPLFTRAKPQDKVPDIVPKQITELQDAVTHNAESIKALAIEVSNELKAMRTLCIVATVVAVLAFCLAAYALAR